MSVIAPAPFNGPYWHYFGCFCLLHFALICEHLCCEATAPGDLSIRLEPSPVIINFDDILVDHGQAVEATSGPVVAEVVTVDGHFACLDYRFFQVVCCKGHSVRFVKSSEGGFAGRAGIIGGACSEPMWPSNVHVWLQVASNVRAFCVLEHISYCCVALLRFFGDDAPLVALFFG